MLNGGNTFQSLNISFEFRGLKIIFNQKAKPMVSNKSIENDEAGNDEGLNGLEAQQG